MITINLKPGTNRARAKSPLAGSLARLKGLGQGVKDPWRIGALVAAVAWLGYVGLAQVSASSTLADLEPKLEQARSENQRFRAFLGEKRALELVRDSIQTQIRTIQVVDGDRYIWPRILDEVARAIPSYTWLTDLQVVAVAAPAAAPADTVAPSPTEPAPVGVSINGRTIDIQGYTRLLRQLEDSPFLEAVTAVSANTVVEQNRAVTAFVLRAAYQRPMLGVRQAEENAAAPSQPTTVAQRGN